MASNGHFVIGKSDVASLKGGSGPRRFSCTAAAVLSIALAAALFGPGPGSPTIRDTVHTFQFGSAPSQSTGADGAANTAPDEAANNPVVASSTAQDPQGATVASSWSMTPVFAPVPPIPSDSASWLRFWLALPTHLG